MGEFSAKNEPDVTLRGKYCTEHEYCCKLLPRAISSMCDNTARLLSSHLVGSSLHGKPQTGWDAIKFVTFYPHIDWLEVGKVAKDWIPENATVHMQAVVLIRVGAQNSVPVQGVYLKVGAQRARCHNGGFLCKLNLMLGRKILNSCVEHCNKLAKFPTQLSLQNCITWSGVF